jgi:hypothetical protein
VKKLRLVIAAVVIAGLLASVACASAPRSEQSVAPESITAPGSAPSAAMTAPPAPAVDYKGAYDEGSVLEDTERMIIRSGDISLVVEDVSSARDEVVGVAVGVGGYVVSTNIYGEGADKRGRISVRVPDEKFDQALVELRALAVRVSSESSDSQDVTEEYVDLESRLKNAEATENQYLALLEKAEDVEDILMVYERLSQVRREIEQLKGRMQYLERTSSMSLLTVHLEPAATAGPLVRVGWSVGETLKSAIRGIVVFAQWLGTIAIWLVVFSPAWGVVLGVILWIRHRRRRL